MARSNSTSVTASEPFDRENRSEPNLQTGTEAVAAAALTRLAPNHEGDPGMRVRNNPMTPVAAVVTGLLAGTAGTACLDAVHYLKYRRAGGADSPLAWNSPRSRTGRRPLTRGKWPNA